MPLLSHAEYVKAREAYSYADAHAKFEVVQTGNLPCTGTFHGVFPGPVPRNHPAGVNLRKLEAICETVFSDAVTAGNECRSTPAHRANIKSLTLAIVQWKMASQGGRSTEERIRSRWTDSTFGQLIRAYQHCSLMEFRIAGVAIPIASALLRFTHPHEFGIIDSRVVKHTQQKGITTLSIRADGYIMNTEMNVSKYYGEYNRFLAEEAKLLNTGGMTFSDFDAVGNPIRASFRPCDIEMALFSVLDLKANETAKQVQWAVPD